MTATDSPVPIYLTVAEGAALLRVSPKRVRNLMGDGTLKEGIHFIRPPHLGPRFKQAALLAWLDPHHPEADEIPLVSSRKRVAPLARESVDI